MSYESYFTFCVAAMALAFVPGPTVTVIIANSLRYGTPGRADECGGHAGGRGDLAGHCGAWTWCRDPAHGRVV